jgi:hypothetical protein
VARDFIHIDVGDSSADGANPLKACIEQLRAARGALERIQGWMVHSNDGSVWTDLETKFGLVAGNGSVVFTLIDGSLQAMDGTSSGYISELIDRVG